MASVVGWLAYSEAERQRMREVIDLFRDRDTVDELGLGNIRDALADLLFPGLSTIQTRARYFLFIPWVYRRIEQEKIPSERAAQVARSLQTQLIKALENGGATGGEGIIGWDARDRLRRLPSSVYWSGLATFDIRLFEGSGEQYHRSLDGFYRSLRDYSKGEGDELHERLPVNWNANLPEPPSDLWDETTIALSFGEAEFLQQQIVLTNNQSLLAHLAQNEVTDIDSTPLPWELPGLDQLRNPVRDWLHQARIFSEVMHGAALAYNLMLARLAVERGFTGTFAELAAKYEASLEEWADAVNARGPGISSWDLSDLWAVVPSRRVSLATRSFVGRWVQLAQADPDLAAAIPNEVQQLIRNREQQLKQGQARLHSTRALEMWRGESGAGQLNYRWPTARRILSDMYEGLDGA